MKAGEKLRVHGRAAGRAPVQYISQFRSSFAPSRSEASYRFTFLAAFRASKAASAWPRCRGCLPKHHNAWALPRLTSCCYPSSDGVIYQKFLSKFPFRTFGLSSRSFKLLNCAHLPWASLWRFQISLYRNKRAATWVSWATLALHELLSACWTIALSWKLGFLANPSSIVCCY
jgi:hypothetical protein